MHGDPLLALLVPGPVLDATAATETEIVGDTVLPVREGQWLSVEDDVYELFLVLLGRVEDPIEVVLVLGVQALEQRVFKGEVLVAADDYLDERVDEAGHTSDRGEDLVERIDRVSQQLLLAVLDHGHRQVAVVTRLDLVFGEACLRNKTWQVRQQGVIRIHEWQLRQVDQLVGVDFALTLFQRVLASE